MSNRKFEQQINEHKILTFRLESFFVFSRQINSENTIMSLKG